jgi:xylitol oxidase
VHAAGSVEEVRELVGRLPKVKALGSRHCFNAIADSDRNLISIHGMNRVVALDPEARTVTVEGGVRYGELAGYLYEKGFALHNLASLPHISVVGSCATATHGSGVGNKNLATQVAGLEVVTADGEVRKFSRGVDAAFAGAVVNLGALGVVTRVTLDVEPAFTVRQDVYVDLPMGRLRDHFREIVSSGYSVSLFTDWRDGRIGQVWVKRRVDAGGAAEADREFYDAKLATEDLHPIAGVSAENCTEQMGVAGPWHERLPHFRMGFMPSAGKELQSEYFVPLGNAVDAILAVERLRDRVSPHLMISELRTVAGDDLWMSPCYRRPSLAIHFTWKQDWEAVRKVLGLVERELSAFGARPHWGKLFVMPPAELRSRYERLGDFKALVEECDPLGKFRNEWLAVNLYG